ncbi:unnamed protein product [Bursaphelenchus xylophilus]|nr:unnamed protein product [Bursaphelenchus xylophilus]CAG9121934.1 unnamed protein product [Bursaphelenchus xylophilus]
MNNDSEWLSSTPTAPAMPTRSFTEMLEIIIYTVCLLIGGPLNAVSFYRLLKNMKKTKNSATAARSAAQITLLRLNLNIADLLTMFVYTTSQIIWMVTYQWYGGDFLCRLCKFFHTFGFYLNSFVVACIAIDRVFGTYNLSTLKASRRSYMRCWKMLVVAWVFAFFLSVPQSFVFRVFEPPGMGNFKQCTPVWTIISYEIDIQISTQKLTPIENKDLIERFHQVLRWERIYNIAHLLFVFWVPALIIVASYALVLCLLNQFTPKSVGESTWKSSLMECLFTSGRYKKPSSPTNSYDCEAKTPTTTPRPSVAEVPPSLVVSLRQEPDATTNCLNVEKKKSLSSYRDRSMSGSSLKLENGSNGTHRSSIATPRMVGQFALQTITLARQRAKRQAAFIIVAYLTFWTPYNLLAVMNTLAPSEGTLKQVASVTLPFLNSLIVVNPIVNPLIYGLFDKKR